MKLIEAKKISYDWTMKRKYKDVKYIVIHNTANKGDTAKNNADYFARTNTGKAGAHLFGDQKGTFIKSVRLNRAAWAVGGFFTNKNGAGKYYGKCTNYNSVSIELCDIVDKDPSKAMIKGLRKAIKYVQRYCPNATTIIRHWDVNGKNCPVRFKGSSSRRWKNLLKQLGYTKGRKLK